MGVLHEAVKAGDLERVKALVVLGCPLNEADENNYHPLDYALDGEADVPPAVLEYLLGQGATDAVCGTPLLLWRLGRWSEERLAVFVRNIDVGAKDWKGDTALHTAAAGEHNSSLAVQILLARGGDPMARNDKGLTPRDYAVMCGNAESAAMLAVAEAERRP